MKTAKKRTNYRRKVLLTSALAVLLIGGAAAAYIRHHDDSTAKSIAAESTGPRPVNSVDYSPPNPGDNNSNEDRKTSPNPSTTLDNGSSAPTSTTFSVKIVSDNETGPDAIHVGTQINGTTGGDCTLTATQAGQQDVILTSSVRQDVNTYDCGPLNMQLPSGGTWNLALTVVNSGTKASDSTSVSL